MHAADRSIRQHTSAYVAYVRLHLDVLQRKSPSIHATDRTCHGVERELEAREHNAHCLGPPEVRTHTSAYVSLRQHTSHTSHTGPRPTAAPQASVSYFCTSKASKLSTGGPGATPWPLCLPLPLELYSYFCTSKASKLST
jgi:hypothetical protein